MNNRAGHVEEGDLLRLIDGELPESDALAARAHIEACWSCRAQFQEIEMVIGEYVRYQKTTDPWLPPPPKAWPELRFRAASADPEPAPPALFLLPPRRWFDLRWALAAAALLVAAFIMYRLQKPPVVSAAELLRNASAVEPVTGAIRIRTKGSSLVRPAVLHRAAADDDVRLRLMFERAHFDWDQPLSARTFAAWRRQLSEKEDEVKFDGDAYVIRTSTSAGELHRATMTLRARDLRPLREMLEFAGETVEVDQVPEPAAAPAAPRQITGAPARPEKAEPSPQSTLHRMLEVFSTLHRLGADLGEPVEIRQNAGTIDVAAIGLTAARQRQLQAAMQDIPSVTVHFDPGTPRAAPARKAQSNPLNRASGQTRLEALLGSPQAAEDFTDRALDASDAVLARVHALRALARAFPPAQESALSAGDQHLLTELRHDHVTALTQKIADLRAALLPVIGNASPDGAAADSATWQDAAQKLLTAAQQLDETLNRELASDAASANDFGRISRALSHLDREAVGIARY